MITTYIISERAILLSSRAKTKFMMFTCYDSYSTIERERENMQPYQERERGRNDWTEYEQAEWKVAGFDSLLRFLGFAPGYSYVPHHPKKHHQQQIVAVGFLFCIIR